MASIRFVSKDYRRDKIIDSADIQGKTLLDIAREHGIPMFSRCGKGMCGGCLVEIDVLDMPLKKEITLGELEQKTLQAIGKFTIAQSLRATHNGIPLPYRLACQYLVEDESLLVRY